MHDSSTLHIACGYSDKYIAASSVEAMWCWQHTNIDAWSQVNLKTPELAYPHHPTRKTVFGHLHDQAPALYGIFSSADFYRLDGALHADC